MTAQHVLVTGGAGFIGSHIVDALLAAGHRVRVLDNLLPAAWGAQTPERPADAEFVRGDVRDADTVAGALADVDAVCHQAAMVGHGVDLADAPEYVGINELGTAVLLAQLARADIGRLVLASSMVVYGEGAWRCAEHGSVRIGPRRREHLDAGRFDPTCPTCGRAVAWSLVDESAPLDPRSVYAASKASQEFLSSAWQRATGGSVTALRYHNVYGPRMPQDTPYSGVAAMFRSSVERGETPRVFEDGQQMRDFVHVTDVARANLLALHRDEASMVSLNVCSGQPHSIGDLAAAISAAAGGPPPQVTGEYRLGDVRHIVASGAGAEQAIGFIAERDFPSGAAQFASDPLRGSARIGGPRPVTT